MQASGGPIELGASVAEDPSVAGDLPVSGRADGFDGDHEARPCRQEVESVTLKVTEYCPEIVGVPLMVAVLVSGARAATFPLATAHEYGARPPLADKRGRVRHADGPDGQAGRRDRRRSDERGDGGTEVRARTDSFAVGRGGAGHPGQRCDAGRRRSGSTSYFPRRSCWQCRSPDHSAGRRAATAHGRQGRRSGRGPEVDPRRTAVCRPDDMRPAGHAVRVSSDRRYR